MLMDLTKVAVVELIHADQHRAADMTIIPMAAPEEIRAILVVAKVFQSVQPEQLAAALGQRELDLGLQAAVLAMARGASCKESRKMVEK